MFKYQINLKGRKFGRWLVIKRANILSDGERKHWICKCICGNKSTVSCYSLLSGLSTSCGCLALEKNTIHGQWNHPLKKVHEGMISRCYNNKDKNFHNYGGRGIAVCKRWRHKTKGILNFINDMYPTYKVGNHIDRRDNNRSYTKNNCRWVTPKINCNNRRCTRFLKIKGIKYPVTVAAEKFGIGPKTILYRLNLGWPHEDCISKPYLKRTELDIKLNHNIKKGSKI